MKNWSFAFQRRWFTYLGMAVVFSVACVLLSQWQFSRNAETVTQNKLVTRNYNAPEHPLAEVLGTTSAYSPGQIWRTVTMTGRYLPSKQLLVRDRSQGSNPGFDVLTPLQLADGSTFVIDRGWVPVGTKHDYPDVVPAAPSGQVSVTARLQGSEGIIPGRGAPAGEISEINLPTVAKHIGSGQTYTGAYGLLRTESPAPATRPIAAAKPVIDPGPFLSYAFQWILFALFAFSGLAWALRQEYRIRNAADPEERERAAERERKARLRAPTDADIEDALVDGTRAAAAVVPSVEQATAQLADRDRLASRYGSGPAVRVRKAKARTADDADVEDELIDAGS